MARRPLTIEQKARLLSKGLSASLGEIEHALKRDGVFQGTAKARGVSAVIRVIVRAKSPIPEAWAMAVLFDNERIDGIDWHLTFDDHRGPKFPGRGWHRHVWKPIGRGNHREGLGVFEPRSVREFIQNGFKVLKVQLGRSGKDVSRQLSLD